MAKCGKIYACDLRRGGKAAENKCQRKDEDRHAALDDWQKSQDLQERGQHD